MIGFDWIRSMFGKKQAIPAVNDKPASVKPVSVDLAIANAKWDVVDRDNNINPVLMKVGLVKSELAADVKLKGDLEINDNGIRIRGVIEGNITQHGPGVVIVDKSAVVTGEIRARYIVILGRVTGKVVGERIIVGSSALIEGDIRYRNTFAPIAGTKIRGNVEQQDDPLFPDGHIAAMPHVVERKNAINVVQQEFGVSKNAAG